MDYHNVSCQTLTLQYFKDTLRYVKLFGALKSILKHCGMAVPGSKTGGWQRCCSTVESEQGPSSTGGKGSQCTAVFQQWVTRPSPWCNGRRST